jgi:hypothetical protein
VQAHRSGVGSDGADQNKIERLMMIADDLDHSTAAAPGQFLDSPFSRVIRQPLILGLFLPVQSGGWSASLLPRTTDWTFDYNAALTRRAEELGFDLVFGLAQWTSKGGYYDCVTNSKAQQWCGV